MIYQNLNIILALLIGVLLNVISGWIIVSKHNRWRFLVLTILLVSIYISIEWDRSQPEKKTIVDEKFNRTNVPIPSVDATESISSAKVLTKNSADSSSSKQNESKETGIYTIIDNEQNTYPIFQKENLVWLAQNLNVTVDKEDWLCYDNNPEYCKVYGKLYSWEGGKKACKKLGNGWRLPTEKDFHQLLISDLGGFYWIGTWSSERKGNPEKGYKNLIDGSLKGFNIQFGGACNNFIRNSYYGIDSIFSYWVDSNEDNAPKSVIIGPHTEIVIIGAPDAIYYEHIRDGRFSCRCVIDSVLFFK